VELTQDNIIIALTALLALSEFLALFPGVAANSVFQLIVGILKKLVPAK